MKGETKGKRSRLLVFLPLVVLLIILMSAVALRSQGSSTARATSNPAQAGSNAPAGLASQQGVSALSMAPSGGGPSSGIAAAQNAAPNPLGGTTVRHPDRVDRAVRFDVSPPLASMKPLGPSPSRNKEKEPPENPPVSSPNGNATGPDPVRQLGFGPLAMPTPLLSFEGEPNLWGVFPPDPNGAIGRSNFIEIVNSGFAIYNRAGTALYGPADTNTLFTGFGGLCETTNDGDPIVLYDAAADRWLLSQFAGVFISNDTHQCFAISTGPDPLGSYYRYDFHVSPNPNTFEDYPKISVWPDAYYMSTNQFGGTNPGGAYAFNRAKMLQGNATAEMVYFGVNIDGFLPADFDGQPPPAGSPDYFMALGPTTTQLQEYRFHVDFSNPPSSTWTGPFVITVPAYNPSICAGARGACVDQPGTVVKLEAIADRMMYRLQYRNFGTHESLVVNHTVNASGGNPGVAGVRWYEIRDPGGTPVAYQAGTYSPDSTHRWMGSAAMDRTGDIAVGFSESSTTVYPSIYYAGRLVSDPINTLNQGEALLTAGGGSQLRTQATNDGRWGDYTSLMIDPLDGCTFWYTNEYIRTTTDIGWTTRIGSFRFPSCVAQGTPTPVPPATGTPPTSTPTPSATPTFCAGGVVVTSSIVNTDPRMTGRLSRGNPPNTCANPRGYPGTIAGVQPHYKTFTYTNPSASPECVSVLLDARACQNSGVFGSVYLNSFDPNNLQTNYLADEGHGGSLNGFSFTVPGNATYVIVVQELGENLGCASFTLYVNPCGAVQGTPTNTPMPASPTPTSTPVCGPGSTWLLGPTHDPARELFQGVLGNDGKYYVVGGQTGDGSTVFGDFARFNPTTNAWEALPPLPTPVGQDSVSSYNGKIYVAGGYAASGVVNILQIYDIASNTWSTGASMPAAVEAAAGAALNGKVYVVGGDNGSVSERATYIYDIATNAWSTGPQVPDTNGRTNTYGTAYNGKVYVFGGGYIQGTTTVAIDTLIVYDPGTNAWTDLGSANLGGYGNYAAVTTYGAGKLFVTDGGTGGFAPTNTTHVYDIASNTWTPGPTMLMPHLGQPLGELPDGRLIVYGGDAGGGTDTNATELLTPNPPCLTETPTTAPQPSSTNTSIVPPAPTSTPCPLQYTDVPPDNPFYTYIRCLTCRGIVSGYDTTPPCTTGIPCFNWGGNITRGQISKMVSNAAGFEDTIPSTQQTYHDVPPSNTFWLWIERLTFHNVMSGYNCGGAGEPCDLQQRPYFRWGANATRGQLAKIVANADNDQTPIPSTQQTYEDVPSTNTFWLWIERLSQRGVMGGYTCGTPPAGQCVPPQNRPYFLPFNNVTRGQASKIVANTFFPNCQTPLRRQ